MGNIFRRVEAQDGAVDAPFVPGGRALEEILLEAIAGLDDASNAGTDVMCFYSVLDVGQRLALGIRELNIIPSYRWLLTGIVDMLGYAKCAILVCFLTYRFIVYFWSVICRLYVA